ncbi:MAG: CoA pyrophosphatase [Actinomycetales bacterium]|nr:CoA pyrophosphatase [Actinomycetales bacterium]
MAERAGDAVEGAPWRRILPPAGGPGQRQSAVLMLFAPGATTTGGHTTPAVQAPQDVSILLTERAHTLRSHPGQVSFPGGRSEPGDKDLVDTALRETHEEVGVEPGSVEVAGVLPPLNLVVSSHDVSPVLGWWPVPGRAWVRDQREVARVLQVPVSDLVDPVNRFRVGHPGGWVGPAFQAEDLVVWGFTALLLDGILRLSGWEVPWDESDVRPVP